MADSTFLLILVALVVGVSVGFALGAFSRRTNGSATHAAELATLRGDAATARADAARAREEQARSLANSAGSSIQVLEAQRLAAEARESLARISARVAAAEAERDAAVQRAEELAADRESMANQFKVLSAETLEQHTRAAEATASARFKATEQLMAPVSESLKQMQVRISEVERSRESMSAELREQIRGLVTTNESLRKETQSLSTALRTPQLRGAWGEQSLRRIVEVSGMVERCDFFQQASTRTEDGLFRPDLTIKLAGDKVVFVDSKVPLTSLLDAYSTTDEAQQSEHLQRFAKLVKNHIDDLSKKNYWALDSGSPEFVVLFLPSEEIFHAALQQQPELQEYASTKQIVLASPSILIGLLKTVAHAWQQERLAESAAEVQKLGRELYERLTKMGEHFESLGRGLTQAMKSYNSAIGSYESRVLVSARRFNDLDISRTRIRPMRGIDEVAREITAPDVLAAMSDEAIPPTLQQLDDPQSSLPSPGEEDYQHE